MAKPEREKRIVVQGVSWEEASGAWFSELGAIEKRGSEWFFTLYEDEQEREIGPFMNPSQAAKKAALEASYQAGWIDAESTVAKHVRLKKRVQALRSLLGKAEKRLAALPRL